MTIMKVLYILESLTLSSSSLNSFIKMESWENGNNGKRKIALKLISRLRLEEEKVKIANDVIQ